MAVTSLPSSSILPDVGSSQPALRRRTVVLPEPDGPSMEKNSPWRMSRSTPSTATVSPKTLLSLRRRIAGTSSFPVEVPAASVSVMGCALLRCRIVHRNHATECDPVHTGLLGQMLLLHRFCV